jgi:DNA-binding transcriptional ArsR family regulator
MDMFSALAEPHRRSILEMLASSGQLSASAIAREFRVSPPAISQHLKVLREAGLVRMQKRAQQRLYQVNPESMRELEDWARRMAGEYERRFDALERIAKAEQQRAASGSERVPDTRRRKRRAKGRKIDS